MSFLTTAIPVYNGEPFIGAALECLAAQERPPDRVIVLDNRSTDRTPAIVAGFAGRLPVEFRQNETNIGSAANLNRCLELASQTEYLHLLLADDLIKPGFYRTLLPQLEPFQGRALGWSAYELIDRHGRVLETTLVRPDRASIRRVPLNEFLEAQSELRSVCCPAVLHKTARQPSPSFFRTDMPQVADTVMYSEWACACEGLVGTGEVLCQNRHHPWSATSANLRSIKATVMDEWKAVWLIFQMIREPDARHWVRRQKLKCLFAARSEVKRQLMAMLDPAAAAEIDIVLPEILSPAYRLLGKCAVALRDRLLQSRGLPSKAEELRRLYAHAKAA